ncbi:MAG: hypothetical protein AAF578_05570 [Pseudomonadota bacterium]
MKKVILLLILGSAGCASTDGVYSGAEKPEPATGTRLPPSGDREDPRRKTVIDRDDLEESGALTIEEALRRRGIG